MEAFDGLVAQRCTTCSFLRTADQFNVYYEHGKPRWHRGTCLSCRQARKRADRTRNKAAFSLSKVPESKKCSRCQETKPCTRFTISRSSRDGLDYVCKDCKHSVAVKAYDNRKKSWDPWKLKGAWLSHGLSQVDYERLLKRQNGVCAICLKEMRIPHVDHDHATNLIRGLLCQRCNTFMAAVDEPDFVEKARTYIDKANIEPIYRVVRKRKNIPSAMHGNRLKEPS